MEMKRKITQDNFVTEKIDVIKNNLLGDYDDEGNYIISEKIISELLSIPKIKKSSYIDSIFCVGSLLGYGEISFEMTLIRSFNNDVIGVKLYVLEPVDKINGYIENTIKTQIFMYDGFKNNPAEEAMEYYNISESDDDEGKENKDLADDISNTNSFILAKKQYSLSFDKLTDEKFLDAYGKYFTQRLGALAKLDSEFAKTVTERFNSEYELIQKTFLQNKNYKMLNELLDKCIEEISGTKENFKFEEIAFNREMEGALGDFTENYNKVSKKFQNKALSMLSKEDREKMSTINSELSGLSMEEESFELGEGQIADEFASNISTEEMEADSVNKAESFMDYFEAKNESEGLTTETDEAEILREILSKELSKAQPETPEINDATTSFDEKKVIDLDSEEEMEESSESTDEKTISSLKDRISKISKFSNGTEPKTPDSQEIVEQVQQEQAMRVQREAEIDAKIEKLSKSGTRMDELFSKLSSVKEKKASEIETNNAKQYRVAEGVSESDMEGETLSQQDELDMQRRLEELRRLNREKSDGHSM